MVLKTICAFVSIIPVRCRLHLQGSKLVMEQRGPQDAENTTVISAHSAEDVGSPDLVAPKKRHDRALRSLENWLSPHLGLKPGECKDLALKILSGNIRNKVPTGQTLRKLLRMPDAEEAMKFFSVVGIDEVTAQRLRDSCRRDTCRMPAATELSSRKRRHATKTKQCAP